jgi:hypothetical protein
VSARVLNSNWLESVLSAALAVVICLGSAFLWIGVPAGGLWIAGQVTRTPEGFLLFVLGGIPLTMIAVGFLLFRVNAVYERLRPGGPAAPRRAAWLDAASEERPSLKRLRAGRSLLEVSMAVSVVAALVLLVVWFFFIAEMTLVSGR